MKIIILSTLLLLFLLMTAAIYLCIFYNHKRIITVLLGPVMGSFFVF